jgi:predicted nuclease of restriction endonuclease-like (RecB) superfamily
MLELYWSIGADIVNMQAESKWGSGVIRALSQELRSEFSGARGFSETNLRYMKRFYLMYSGSIAMETVEFALLAFQHQAGAEIDSGEIVALNQSGQDIPPEIASVPWRHHMEIISHTETLEEAIFYVEQTIENGWSRSTLKDKMKSDLYSRQGKALNNFSRLLPVRQSALAGEMLKDPYMFDFISLRDEYIERELEAALVENVTKLLMELGHGFAFLGRQVPVMAGTKELWIDLLFYHVDLHCYIVVELKTEDFEAAHTGQLGAYVAAVNHQMKSGKDNPTIGLLICKSKDNVYAGYSLDSVSQPIGIAAYELADILPEEFKSTLPSIEDIEATLKE